MAQFVSYDANAETLGSQIVAFVEAIPMGKDFRMKVLAKHGIAPQPDRWYSQQRWLDAMKEVYERLGPHSLFMLGLSVIEKTEFPPVADLKDALELLDDFYRKYHRGGKIGGYSLLAFDPEVKQAILRSSTPYASDYDRGLITGIVRRFKPKKLSLEKVVLDETKETRQKGGDSCTFVISW